jgi:hypothetical protein
LAKSAAAAAVARRAFSRAQKIFFFFFFLSSQFFLSLFFAVAIGAFRKDGRKYCESKLFLGGGEIYCYSRGMKKKLLGLQ